MELTPNRKIRRALPDNSYSGVQQYENIGEKGQETLEKLRASVDQGVDEQSDAAVSVRYEYWVRYYLEEYADAFGFEIVGDLDEERPTASRGDYRVKYDGQEMVLEVEKDVEDFFKHGHETEGSVGWGDISSIDILFAVSDRNGRRDELNIPVVLSDEYASEGDDCDTFEQWYRQLNKVKTLKEAFYADLLQAVYYDLFKGIPGQKHLLQRGSEMDDFSLKMNKRYFEAIHDVAGIIVKRGVDWALFNRDDSVAEGEEFDDVRKVARSAAGDISFRQTGWDCPQCGDELVEVGESRFTYDADPRSMTEGQFADQLAAKQGGFFEEGIHGETITVEYCFDCLVLGAKAPREKSPLFFDNDVPFNPSKHTN